MEKERTCEFIDCNGMVTGRARYCSPACKQAAYRNKRNTPTVTDATVTQVQPVTVEPKHYAPRTNYELLNWGPWMTRDELARAGLTANRVSIPGDWDYDGVCVMGDEGNWSIYKDPTNQANPGDHDYTGTYKPLKLSQVT